MTSWRPGWDDFPQALLDFWTERHLCTLTTLRADGRPHVVPVGVALDLERQCAWVIAPKSSLKIRNVSERSTLAACQVDGPRWSTIEGTGTVLTGPESVARACEQYAARYRTPRENPQRAAVQIKIELFLGSSGLWG